MTARMSTRHSRWNIWSLYRCLRCCRCRMVPNDHQSPAALRVTGISGRVQMHHPPFRETMIHIKNAVRVRDRGKMRIMTMNKEALCSQSARRRTSFRAVSKAGSPLYHPRYAGLTSSSTSTVPTEYSTEPSATRYPYRPIQNR
jgi:hypothetical protein